MGRMTVELLSLTLGGYFDTKCNRAQINPSTMSLGLPLLIRSRSNGFSLWRCWLGYPVRLLDDPQIEKAQVSGGRNLDNSRATNALPKTPETWALILTM